MSREAVSPLLDAEYSQQQQQQQQQQQ